MPEKPEEIPDRDDLFVRRLTQGRDRGPTVGASAHSLRWREHNMEDDESLDAQDQSDLVAGADDARGVVDFAVGPPGVGPVMGFDSDDFFPAPEADIVRNRTD